MSSCLPVNKRSGSKFYLNFITYKNCYKVNGQKIKKCEYLSEHCDQDRYLEEATPVCRVCNSFRSFVEIRLIRLR